jgi:hypothetical protein
MTSLIVPLPVPQKRPPPCPRRERPVERHGLSLRSQPESCSRSTSPEGLCLPGVPTPPLNYRPARLEGVGGVSVPAAAMVVTSSVQTGPGRPGASRSSARRHARKVEGRSSWTQDHAARWRRHPAHTLRAYDVRTAPRTIPSGYRTRSARMPSSEALEADTGALGAAGGRRLRASDATERPGAKKRIADEGLEGDARGRGVATPECTNHGVVRCSWITPKPGQTGCHGIFSARNRQTGC